MIRAAYRTAKSWTRLRTNRSRWPFRGVSLCILVASLAMAYTMAPKAEAASPDSMAASEEDPLAADEDLAELAREYIEAVTQKTRLEIQRSFYEHEIDQLQDMQRQILSKNPTMRLKRVNEYLLPSVLSAQEQNFDAWQEDVEATADTMRRDAEESQKYWVTVRSEANQQASRLFDVKAQSAFATRLALLLNKYNRWLWVWGVFAVCMFLLAFWFSDRQYYRRLFWVWRGKLAGRIGLLFLLFAVPVLPLLIIFFFGNRTYESLASFGSGQDTSPRQTMTAEIDAIQQAVEQEDLEQKTQVAQIDYELATEEWLRNAVATLETPRSGDIPQRWATTWLESRKTVLNLEENQALLKAYTDGLDTDLKRLEQLNQELGSHESNWADVVKTRQTTSGFLGAGLLLFYGGMSLMLLRRLRRRRVENAKTCPRCLAVGTLEPVQGKSLHQVGAGELRCTNVISDDPFEECEFVFNETYRERIKLCFPTLGVAESGKTHGLTMMYRELNLGRCPDHVHFERIRSAGSEQFDKLVDMVLNQRMKLGNTLAHRLPHPLIFSFRDNDRFGKSNVLANLFDYAGQVTRDVEHQHRYRALNADGYFFFLDPTKVAEKQIEALANFREDLRIYRRIKDGQQIHSPVALCLSKLDLLVNQDFGQGSDVVSQFYDELDRIDGEYPPFSREMIERRSELMANMRDVIWPGWNIEREIQNLFGDRFAFFPLTPVGLDRPGVEDLSQRNIEPYGILEPLLWLLHINMYPILK